MVLYYTEYSNQVHQLNVSISKHFYILKDRSIKFQHKPSNIQWSNRLNTERQHLVNYIIRDCFSNAYYAEVCPATELMPIDVFLFRAWRRKQEYPFHGIPKTLIAPKVVIEHFPDIKNLYKNVSSIYLQEATSGFNAGVRVFRDWENELKLITFYYKGCQNLEGVLANIEIINGVANTRMNSKKNATNLTKWQEGIKSILNTGEEGHFRNLFKDH